jgi:hypothetical protein
LFTGVFYLITCEQSYKISAVIPAVQSFWVRLMALDMDIWPTLTTRRSQELIVTWIRKRAITLLGDQQVWI